MKKIALTLLLSLGILPLFSQNLQQQLKTAYQLFAADSQLRHAVSSLYVIDAATGDVLFDINSQTGLAPASTQKIITSVTSFELLGKDFRYKTELAYDGAIQSGSLNGNLYLLGTGDPTLGSWRWPSTRDSLILNRWLTDVKNAGIKKINGSILFNWSRFSAQSTPDGWIWQDIGNYYGAGARVLNWRENQFDLTLKSDNNLGSRVTLVSPHIDFINELKTDVQGSGDNAYAYLPIAPAQPLLSGTIPVNEDHFHISIADTDPIQSLLNDLSGFLNTHAIPNKPLSTHYSTLLNTSFDKKLTVISTWYSPALDSIIYWFNKKSINLYGEALIKTLAYGKTGYGSTDAGVGIVRDFWKGKGLDDEELNIVDGSGLSPLNRVTTHAQVEILRYARNRDWFPLFYNALPEYNGMKMKSGTIHDVKGFCGYQQSSSGKQYIFSFLVNNYSGSASQLVNKMYRVLDVLKL